MGGDLVSGFKTNETPNSQRSLKTLSVNKGGILKIFVKQTFRLFFIKVFFKNACLDQI